MFVLGTSYFVVGGREVNHSDSNLGGSGYEESKLFSKYWRLSELGVLEG